MKTKQQNTKPQEILEECKKLWDELAELGIKEADIIEKLDNLLKTK